MLDTKNMSDDTLLEYNRCDKCIHQNICKLKDIKENIECKISKIITVKDERLHIVVDCDEYIYMYNEIPLSMNDPKISWQNK